MEEVGRVFDGKDFVEEVQMHAHDRQDDVYGDKANEQHVERKV